MDARRLIDSRRLDLVWWGFATLAIAATAVISVPQFRQAEHLSDPQISDPESLRRSLSSIGLSPRFLAIVEATNVAISFAVAITVGWLLLRMRPRQPYPMMLAFAFVASAASVYPPSIDDYLPDHPGWALITRLLTIFGIANFFLLPFLFPDGRFVPKWMVLAGGYVATGIIGVAFGTPFDTNGAIWQILNVVTTLLFVAAIVYTVLHRYHHASTRKQREQTKWVVFGLLISLPGFFLGDAMMRNIGAGTLGILCLLGFIFFMPVATNAVVVTVGIAIVRYRLFDIDVIVNRTLVWLTMTALVIATYIGVVLGIGTLIHSDNSLVLSIAATGLVALAFEPVRSRVQRSANRLLYGDRDEPYAVISRLGQRIDETLSHDDLLPTIVKTTAEALRLPYTALLVGTGNHLRLAAVAGTEPANTLSMPLHYQGEAVGMLVVAPRGPGEVFGPSDRRLLDDLARQIGVAVHTVQLTEDLQQSRARIVTAREEERRRLRRDLHDGLGAQLAALSLQAGVVRTLIASDAERAESEIVQLRDELRAAVGDIRRLVHGLRPPALDDLGLTGALREMLARFEMASGGVTEQRLRIHFDAPEAVPHLPAAAEVAIFRITEEAVTNIVKHAQARTATIQLHVLPQGIELTIADDGVGLPGNAVSGVGMQSMRERTSELGGTFAIHAQGEANGTTVAVSIPLQAERGKRSWTASGS